MLRSPAWTALHAHVQVEAHERERLEHLCRYVVRSDLAVGAAPTPAEILDSVLGPTTVQPLLAAPVPRPDDPPATAPSTPRRQSWSELMRRVFAIDVLA